MTLSQITVLSFSPCGGTVSRALFLADALGEKLHLPVRSIDYTLPESRATLPPFQNTELLIWASPVYAGRLPNKITPFLVEHLRSNGSPLIALVSFGNRSHGEALSEMVGIGRRAGCLPLAAAALAMPHVFSPTLAHSRPNPSDNEAMLLFAEKISNKLQQTFSPLPPFGNEDPSSFYTPLRTDGTPARFLKALPVVDPSLCNSCGLCASLCPTACISHSLLPSFSGACIKCHACINRCPQHTLHFSDPDFLSHVSMLEENFSHPAENLFII